MSSERDKMLAGELYDASDPELVAMRLHARGILARLNGSPGRPDERSTLHSLLFGAAGAALTIEPPFYCDYGKNIRIGDRVFLNFNCIILDPAPVTLGNDVFLGPAVQIYTATHPLDPRLRRRQLEYALPVVIGSDVWIGGGAIIFPGVRIGERSVIGGGSVVTKDIPEGVLAVGNPCRVVREIIEK